MNSNSTLWETDSHPRRKTILCVLMLVITTCVQGCVGKTFDRWETENSSFRIRITAQEEGGWVGGANYLFESALSGSDDWREIMKFRHDDPVPIPRDQVQLLNDKIGYMFIGWIYAVTTDGGKSWSVWTAEQDLRNWRCCNYKLIRSVQIALDGTGTMILNSIPDREGEVPELYTRDYGRHWHPR